MALGLTAQAEPITALTSDNRLITFDSASPGTSTDSVAITGLQTGETLVGIDFRPATGSLYGISSTGRIYRINADTGTATGVGTAAGFTLTGTSFGVDFNPAVDRIRITSDADQNLRANPNDGTAIVDSVLQYAATDTNAGENPNVVGSAYTNNFAGAQATTLYDIDSNLDILALQNPPNPGTLVTVGELGVDTGDGVGFDISGTTGVAYASLTVSGIAQLYTINLLNGAATPAGATATASIITPATLGTASVIDIAAGVNPGSRLRNISTRAKVGQGEDVLIGGFITRGGVSTRVILRGIGPSLAGEGVGTPLADPVLTLYDKNGQAIATNDNWKSDAAQRQEIEEADLAPENDNEAAIVATLPPDEYTVQVTGKGAATGVALVEIFQIDR